MKIYFTASVTYREKLGDIYQRIVDKLIALNHEVEATHALKHAVNEIHSHRGEQTVKDYEDMMNWIEEADVVVCEVSFPSTVTNGHVITRALERGKPVLALYREGSVPPLLLGLELERFKLVEYNSYNLENVLEREIDELLKLPDIRFTLLLPSDIVQHLDKIARTGTPRSEYIRNLIKRDMKEKSEE